MASRLPDGVGGLGSLCEGPSFAAVGRNPILRAVAHQSWRLALAITAAMVLTGCSTPFASAPTSQSSGPVQHASLRIGAKNRTYRLFRPLFSLSAQQPTALLVALTGCPSTGDRLAAISRLDGQASAHGFAVVYPDPVDGCWNEGFCCGTADDVGFIKRLVDMLSTEIRVDNSRVFAAGFSAGGAMAYRVACELSDRFIAIASLAGRLDLQSCQPARPVSILEMHGTADTIVSYARGADAVQHWVALDGCSGDPRQTVDGITKTSTWSSCQGGTMVRFDTVEGGHHTWFGSTVDPVPGEPDSSVAAWDFFSHLAPRR
jgi:polyhydroxybutyrate depolymerase